MNLGYYPKRGKKTKKKLKRNDDKNLQTSCIEVVLFHNMQEQLHSNVTLKQKYDLHTHCIYTSNVVLNVQKTFSQCEDESSLDTHVKMNHLSTHG